jgi:hypothetical protein
MSLNKTLYLGIDDFVEKLLGEPEAFPTKFFHKHPDFTVVRDTPENLVGKGVKFLYVFTIPHITSLYKAIPTLDSKVLNYIQSGKCKLIFFYPHEGHIYRKEDISRFIEYCKTYNLNKNNTFLYHSNLKLKECIEEYNLESNYIAIEEIVYFEQNPWFIDLKTDKQDRERLKTLYTNRLNKEIWSDKQFYFNLLNRLPRPHRVLLYVLLYNNPELEEKTLSSLGSYNLFKDPNFSLDTFKRMFSKVGLEMKYRKFLDEKHKQWEKTGLLADTELETNQANFFNLYIYKQSYITIISETEKDYGTIFFSEKTFKPIIAGHPFIIMGGKDSLKKLKELGYKTFDKWWDESYDNIEEWDKRMIEIYNLMEVLSKLDKESIKNMINDMHETLLHNINVFFSNSREDRIYDRLLEIQNS